MAYDIKEYGLIPYLEYRIKRHGLKKLITTIRSGYPQIMALGVCYHDTKEIVICRIGNYKLRLAHEKGHENGLKHTWKIGHIMHPYGIFRGWKE